MLAVLRVYWPGAQILSTPTGTVSSSLKERSRIHRRPFVQRFLSSGTTIHLIYVLIGATCLYLQFKEYDQFRADGHDGHGFPFAGAIFHLAECVAMVSTPLWYMVNPPTVPEMSDLLEEGEGGLARPKARDGHTGYVLYKWQLFLDGNVWSWMQLFLDGMVIALCLSL